MRFYGVNCGLPVADEENPLFDLYNLGKRDIQLDTKTPEGMETRCVFLVRQMYLLRITV